MGGEAANSTDIGDGAVSSSERTAGISEQQVSVSEQVAVNQSIHNDNAVDATSGSGQCATDTTGDHQKCAEVYGTQ
jgi:hypothetical protein